MSELFIHVLNMSISASWIVLVVLLLRRVLHKAPKWIHVLLWGIVAIRLICPISIESVVSLLPSAEVINPTILVETPTMNVEFPAINTGVPAINDTLNPMIHEVVVEMAVSHNVNILQVLSIAFSIIWILGVIGFGVYMFVSCSSIAKEVKDAKSLYDNIYQSPKVESPFVFGIIKPKIYLPNDLSEQDQFSVIAHEKMHIQRKDHLWKPFGFLLLSIHWFNPILWLAYIILCRDIELACDEKVIEKLNREQRADYTQSLLSCSVKRKMIAACPVAFGEVGVNNRVKQVITYKKPAFWLIVVAIVICGFVGVSFLTNPIGDTDKVLNRLENLEYYKIINQTQKVVSLSIDTSKLSDSSFTTEGQSFDKDEVIVYNDKVTKIYLNRVKLSEGINDSLYFEFGYDYKLDVENGFLLYPYVITESGLKDVEPMYYQGVNKNRNQGYLIYFYLNKDIIEETKNNFTVEVYMNRIDYFKTDDAYSKMDGFINPKSILLDIYEYDEYMYSHSVENGNDIQHLMDCIMHNKIVSMDEYETHVSDDMSYKQYHLKFETNGYVYEYSIDKNGYGKASSYEKGWPKTKQEVYLQYNEDVYASIYKLDQLFEYYLSEDTKEWMNWYEELSDSERKKVSEIPEDLIYALSCGYPYQYAQDIMGSIYFTNKNVPLTFKKGDYEFTLDNKSLLLFLNTLTLEETSDDVGNELVTIELDKDVIIYDNYLLKYDGKVYRITNDVNNYYWLVFTSDFIKIKDVINNKELENIIINSYGSDLYEIQLKGDAKKELMNSANQCIVMEYGVDIELGAGGYIYRLCFEDIEIEVGTGAVYIYEKGELITNKQSALVNGSLVNLIESYLPTDLESLDNYEDENIKMQKLD